MCQAPGQPGMQLSAQLPGGIGLLRPRFTDEETEDGEARNWTRGPVAARRSQPPVSRLWPHTPPARGAQAPPGVSGYADFPSAPCSLSLAPLPWWEWQVQRAWGPSVTHWVLAEALRAPGRQQLAVHLSITPEPCMVPGPESEAPSSRC